MFFTIYYHSPKQYSFLKQCSINKDWWFNNSIMSHIIFSNILLEILESAGSYVYIINHLLLPYFVLYIGNMYF